MAREDCKDAGDVGVGAWMGRGLERVAVKGARGLGLKGRAGEADAGDAWRARAKGQVKGHASALPHGLCRSASKREEKSRGPGLRVRWRP